MSYLAPSLPWDIGDCQYRRMSITLPVPSPAGAAPCCSPLSAEPLSAEQAEQVAPLLKALADPVRLRLMSLVASHEGGEACVCDLNDAGLLDRDKRGVWVYYRARTDALASIGTLIGCPPA